MGNGYYDGTHIKSGSYLLRLVRDITESEKTKLTFKSSGTKNSIEPDSLSLINSGFIQQTKLEIERLKIESQQQITLEIERLKIESERKIKLEIERFKAEMEEKTRLKANEQITTDANLETVIVKVETKTTITVPLLKDEATQDFEDMF